MPTQETLDFFKGKLPDRLLEYWQEYGFCGWGDGIFWLVNPLDYHDILQTWLEGTEFAEREKNEIDKYYVIGRGAFGDLVVWGKASGQSLDINSNFGMLFPTDSTEDLVEDGETLTVDLFFATMNKTSLDQKDVDEKPLLEQALKKLGPLEADEMYAFVPALALGGVNKLEKLLKVKAIEHLNFLAELGEKRIMADIVAMSNELHKN
ncbi:GAD-like domain-containing protein [Pseudoalteromonas ruthenica]|uniref:GAD-like domain-containing protein n=1 Tax=Pseudoalteromonas ruthenica TaxID=151081 RepID=UPI00241FCCA2|nr:GAD-like domain-containing protein [Pseudoalteromonas ruthenica]|tara:strand:+ start:44920 stop:45540 length:621 start_codon:yes stop_codon:yes gene_type:complete